MINPLYPGSREVGAGSAADSATAAIKSLSGEQLPFVNSPGAMPTTDD